MIRKTKLCFVKVNISIILICVTLQLTSCNSDGSKLKCDKKNFKGVVNIRAEEEFPLGLISAFALTAADSMYERPLRGIIYTYNKVEPLNIGDTVAFNIISNGEMEYASNVKLKTSSIDFAENDVSYDCITRLKLNLHNADSNHREGPFHRYGHIKSSSNYTNGAYTKIEVSLTATSSQPETIETYLVSKILFNTLNISNYYYFGVIDTFEKLRVVDVTKEHEHRFGNHE